jgi:WD40 repeat protein
VTANKRRTSGGYGTDFNGKAVPTDPPAADPMARPFGGHSNSSVSSKIGSDAFHAALWEADTGKEVAKFVKPRPTGLPFGNVQLPLSAAVAPDGKAIAMTFEAGGAAVWEADTGKLLFDLAGHEGDVLSVDWSSDGKSLATGGADKTVRVWDAATGKELRVLRGPNGMATGVAFDGDGKRLLARASDGTARVWEAATGKELAAIKGHTGAVADAGFSPDGRRLVTAGDSTVRVWSLDPPVRPDRVLTGHAGKVTYLTFGAGGKVLFTASADQTARLWDPATGAEVRVFGQGKDIGELYAVRISADGKRVVTASKERGEMVKGVMTGSAVRVWDAETGKELAVLGDLDSGASLAVFDPTGRRIVTVSDGRRSVRSTGPLGGRRTMSTNSSIRAGEMQSWGAADGKFQCSLAPGNGNFFGSEQHEPAFSPDGGRIVVLDIGKQKPVMLDAATGRLVAELGDAGTTRMKAAYAPDGKTVAVARGTEVRFYDADGKTLPGLRGFGGEVTDMAFSANGQRLVTASGKTTHVWDLPPRKLLATLKGHEADVTGVSVADDGSAVLTGSKDGTAALWDATTGQMRSLYKGHAGTVTRVALRPDGQQAATLGEDGTARLWPADLWPAVAARSPRGLSVEECDRYELPRPGPAPRPAADAVPFGDAAPMGR